MIKIASRAAYLLHPWKAFFHSRTGQVAGPAWIGLLPRRIFILPTRAGLGFAGLLLVMLLGAINYDNNLVFGLTFLLTGLGLVSMLHSYRNLAHLQVRAGQGCPGFVGDRIGFQVWLRPDDARPRFALSLKVAGAATLTSVSIEGNAAWLQMKARQRGPLPLGLVTVSSSYPLGLFYAWSRVAFDHTELAYPEPALPGPPPPTLAEGKYQAGMQQTGSEDFRGLRTYRPGDSLRHVHWKAWAREQGMLIKEFGSNQAHSCWLDFAATGERDAEARLRRLCRWILEAERGQVSYGLRLPGLAIAPARGNAHRDRCLAALATFRITT